jgi:hypothetical protein
MPSHIFTRVGAWAESAATNLRSAEAAKAEKLPGDRLHAMDYMVYAYLQLARDREAAGVVEEARSIGGVSPGHFGIAYALAAMPARLAVERGRWKDAGKLEPRASRFPQTEAITHFARALGAARSGDADTAGVEVEAIARIVQSLKAAKNPYWAGEVEVQRRCRRLDRVRAGQREPFAHALGGGRGQSEKSGVTPGQVLPRGFWGTCSGRAGWRA